MGGGEKVERLEEARIAHRGSKAGKFELICDVTRRDISAQRPRGPTLQKVTRKKAQTRIEGGAGEAHGLAFGLAVTATGDRQHQSHDTW